MKKIENNIFLILSIYLKQNFWLRRANDLWLKKKRGTQKKKYAEANYLEVTRNTGIPKTIHHIFCHLLLFGKRNLEKN